jgi:prevent-host-death family protein
MIDVSQDIESLTSFKRDSGRLMKRMKATGRPVVLTVNGKAQAVVMDPKSYQKMADRLSAITSISRGLAQVKKGSGMDVDEFFDRLDAGK